jgi:hypothetical protein
VVLTGPPGGEAADEIGRLAEKGDPSVPSRAIEQPTAKARPSSPQALVFQRR